ncbi:hypothetical protein [uncultured Polaribacter sp.]|uniref:tetratricopeptide repeat protein n=1 Tax=uncultured Polaribacter sp. TaxID=174711 RepID=UPI00261A1361|nr:hypothetical protein [uncultured Polaribacter sp.]
MTKNILILFLLIVVKVEAQTSTFSTIDSLFENGRYQLALSQLKAINPPTFLSNYKTALIYESIDNYKQTASYLEQALIFKEDKKASLKLAKVYQRLNKSNEAVLIYENLLAKDSMNLVLAYQLGKLYLKTKSYKKSISAFKNLIKHDSTNAYYSYQLALAYAFVKDRDRMINSFLDVYKKDTTHLKAIAHLASSYSKLNEKDSTNLFIEKGLLLDKNHINLNKLKINNLYREKNYVETIPLLLNLDSIDTKETFSISMLGRVYYSLDSLEKSKKYFKKLYRVDRANFKALTYLGHIAMKEKDYKTAGFNYTMATFIGKEKRDEEYFGLATMFYETKKPKQALLNFEKAYKENSMNYNALFQLAKISDAYYKDKKIAYKHYVKYMDNFQERDQDADIFIKRRISEIKKEFFMKGEKLE